MKRVLALLCVTTSLVSCQRSAKSNGPPKPDSGTFAHSVYRNDFFGFSYSLSRRWHKSRISPAPLPGGGYYLFIGDRNTGQPFLNRVVVVADPANRYRPGLSTEQYLADFVRAEVEDSHAEIIRRPFSVVSGGSDFYRADYKTLENGVVLYQSMVSTERAGYWLNWSFVTASQPDLDEAVNTVQQISFDHTSPASQ